MDKTSISIKELDALTEEDEILVSVFVPIVDYLEKQDEPTEALNTLLINIIANAGIPVDDFLAVQLTMIRVALKANIISMSAPDIKQNELN